MFVYLAVMWGEQKKAEVDGKAASGVTALWLAAGEGRDEIVKILINEVSL